MKNDSRFARHRYTILSVLLIIFSLVLTLTVYFRPYSRFPPAEEEITFSNPDEIRVLIEQKGYQWTPEKNDFTEMSFEERKKRLGLIPAGEPLQDPEKAEGNQQDEMRVESFVPPGVSGKKGAEKQMVQMVESAEIPRTLDYRRICTSVKDQGSCGSCWAFAAVGAFEANLIRHNPTLAGHLDLSEQCLFSQEDSCEGGSVVNALSYLMEYGTVPEEYCPYIAEDRRDLHKSLCAEPQTVFKISEFEREDKKPDSSFFSKKNSGTSEWIDSVTKKLLEKGPMIASMNIQKDFWSYGKGIYRSVTRRSDGMHAVVLVGYNIPERYWIVKNSWGTNWGDDGYALISWDDPYTNFGSELYSIEIENGFPEKKHPKNSQLKKKITDPGPINLVLEKKGDRYRGEFELDIKDFYLLAENCERVEFSIKLSRKKEKYSDDIIIFPERFIFENQNSVFPISISTPEQVGCDQIMFFVKPVNTEHRDLTAEVKVNPVCIASFPRPIAGRKGIVYAAGSLLALIGIIFIKRCIWVDKYNFWVKNISSRSPEDFYEDTDAINSKHCEFIKSKNDLIKVFNDKESKHFHIFLSGQKWRNLETLSALCRKSCTRPVFFPFSYKTITLSSFESGENVFRSRNAEFPENFARIEISDTCDHRTVSFFPVQGFFKDSQNAYLPLNSPVLIHQYALFKIGPDSETLFYRLFVQCNDDGITIQVFQND
jgi:C1A family cysteine protease